MNNLNNDIIYYISFKLDFNSLLNFSIIDKNNYQLFDNKFYKYYAIKIFTYDFWIKAEKRPIMYSNPLKNIKMELIRIENFQKNLDNINIKRWTQKDFYDYWKHRDEYCFKKNYNVELLLNNVLNIL